MDVEEEKADQLKKDIEYLIDEGFVETEEDKNGELRLYPIGYKSKKSF